MPSNVIGRQRSDAIYRIGALILYLTIGWVLGLVGFAAGLIWMIIDVILQLVTNKSGWTMRGSGAFLKRLYKWNIDMMEYILFGDGPFPWTP